ncbi:MAG: hypothetical protein JEZ05_08760 [Tenericutes bacterium]|nr:hypothetical protein [Mycoplasmatota bacterium]
MENENKFYQNKRKIKEAISHFTFHLSIFGLFIVFLFVLPNFVEIDASISTLVYYLIAIAISLPVLYLGHITYKRYKSYALIQKMEDPLLELSMEGFIYRIDSLLQYKYSWDKVEGVEFIEIDTGKGINQEILIKLIGETGIKNNEIIIRLFKIDADFNNLKKLFSDYRSNFSEEM